jgi:hypothetical protein
MSDVSASEKQDEPAPIEEALKNERYELLQQAAGSLTAEVYDHFLAGPKADPGISLAMLFFDNG